MSEKKAPELITIGRIVNTQGHLGEVRAIPLTDFPERFIAMKQVTVELDGKRKVLNVANVRKHQQFIVLKFEEIPDMNAAETLKGAELKVTREELVSLPEGSYYIFDIIGLKVVEASGREIGMVKDIISTGSNDVYIVAREETKDLLVPALKSVVQEIDVAGGKITVALPPGLEDL